VAFDIVADRYDATRRLSPEAERATLDILSAELRPRGRCLEIGVGTGRLAMPLSRAGVHLVGLDLSAPMLDRLVHNAGGPAPFPLIRGDATALPFPDAALGAALVAHVLHLIPDWERALAELVRVVRPGGSVVAVIGRFSPDLRAIMERLVREAGIDRPFRGLDHDVDRLDATMARLGVEHRDLGTVIDRTATSIDEFFRLTEQGVWSWTWRADPAARRAATARLRPWAAERFGDLDAPRTFESPISFRAYDVRGD
jgi:SAM-dependent methyltransferase